ncbi:MAG: hypothetical protein SGI72_04700 [Planctomycetota bacterium]|nr:hypothetical protein [Planctomycetota bacterium]
MSSPITKCPQCGARPRSSAKYCEFCGTQQPLAPLADSPAVESHEQRFERLERDIAFTTSMQKRPSAAGPVANSAFAALFMAGFIVLAGMMTFAFAPAGPLMLLPLFILLVGVVLFLRTLGKGAQLATSELIAQPAIIAGERTRVDGGSDGPGHTRYFVTLEARDGKRTEFNATGSLVGRVKEGDIGVAYIKADYLLDFERVRV